MERMNVLLLAVLAALGLSAAQAATLYKWVDKSGRVSYHDQPPPADSGYRVEEKVIGTDSKPKDDDTLAKIAEKYPVVLYSVPACGSCDLARAYLQKRKVPFTEQNLDNNPDLQRTLKKKIGSLSAPTIMVGEKVMKGYVESLLEGELDEVGYPKMGALESSAGEGETQEKNGEPAADDSSERSTRRRY